MDNFEHWGGSFFLKTGGISTYFLVLSIYLNCQDTMILVFLWKFILCISGIMPQFLQVSLTLVFLSNKWYSSGSLPGDQCQLLVEIYIGDRILCIKASYKIANDSHEKKTLNFTIYSSTDNMLFHSRTRQVLIHYTLGI